MASHNRMELSDSEFKFQFLPSNPINISRLVVDKSCCNTLKGVKHINLFIFRLKLNLSKLKYSRKKAVQQIIDGFNDKKPSLVIFIC